MRVLLGVAVALCLGAVPAIAQTYLLMGEGTASCATYLSSPTEKAMGNTWIMGYFSGWPK